jgi:hypothetical protein
MDFERFIKMWTIRGKTPRQILNELRRYDWIMELSEIERVAAKYKDGGGIIVYNTTDRSRRKSEMDRSHWRAPCSQQVV